MSFRQGAKTWTKELFWGLATGGYYDEENFSHNNKENDSSNIL